MNPFSALCYIRENKARSASLVFVMSMSMLTYLLGLYTSSSYVDHMKNIEYFKDFAIIATSEETDSKKQLLELLDSELVRHEKMKIIAVDYFADSTIVGRLLNVNDATGVFWKTMMGFRGGVASPVFHSPEDFRIFADVIGLPYIDEDKSIIMGNKLAKNLNLKIGDSVSNDHELVFGFKSDLTLVDTYDEIYYGVPSQYTFFRVDSAFKPSAQGQPKAVLLLREDGNETDIEANRSELGHVIDRIKDKYDKLKCIDYEYNKYGVIKSQTAYWPIFMVPMLMIGAVLALVSIGIFSVALEKREYELSVFKAIGFSTPQVLRKCIAELLILNFTGIITGVVLIFITVASVNDLLLSSRGLELQYYSGFALISYALCDIAILVPLAAMLVHKIYKCDVVGY